ncbi:hypothetical protein C4Q31_14655 [Leptospira borgpetersenii serovar Ceylonica]|nr:hypothetical protein C4Q31_14655 [Leptospira borgpetersenii serovar Ceylonica]OOV46144.1 hypothetical protein B1H38_03015 [Leptospira borgpetersenii serovar Ballum]QHE28525.1 hypothetical protein GS524_11590 [Leptospira borgpetersenii]QHE31826.1 hypothetical protein GS523_11600 [Leptospira borgpetersenii]QHE35123.1 hypothetical protein GS517_11585 [Leptospira borgpetersenii]
MRKDNCYDDAPGTRFTRTSSLKSFFKTLKVKEVYRRELNTIPMFLVSNLSEIFITFFQVFRQE